MTYTDFVSTLNHRVNKTGYAAMVSDARLWFTPEMWSNEMIAYGMGLLEYCCYRANKEIPPAYKEWENFKLPQMKYPPHVEIMRNMLGDEYVKRFENACIDTFKKHNVCVMEVGNAV